MYMYEILFPVLSLVWCIVWGYATQKIIDIKGYKSNWFWMGFFLGVIAFIIACAKPQNTYQASSTYNTALFSSSADIVPAGSWKCSCGRINPQYTGTCACGLSQHKLNEKQLEQTKVDQSKNNQDQLDNLRLLKEYKDLLDHGIITPDEFYAKKSELLQ